MISVRQSVALMASSSAVGIDGAQDAIEHDAATMMMVRLSAMPSRLQPIAPVEKVRGSRRLFSIPSGPAVCASIDRFSQLGPH